MLWSIGSCQNRVSADQHHMNVLQAQQSAIEVTCFFLVLCARQAPNFQAQLQVDIFAIHGYKFIV